MESKYIWALLLADYEKSKEPYIQIEIFWGRNKYTKTGLFSGPLQRRAIDLSCNDYTVQYALNLKGVVQTSKNRFSITESAFLNLLEYFQRLHMNELYCRLSDKKLHHVKTFKSDNAEGNCYFNYDEKIETLSFFKPNDKGNRALTCLSLAVEPKVRIYFQKEPKFIRAYLYFLYDTVEIAFNDSTEKIDVQTITFLRNHQFEKQILNQLLGLGGKKSLRNEVTFSRKSFYNMVLSSLYNTNFELFWGKENKIISKSSFSCSISYAMDWFSLSGVVSDLEGNYRLTDLLRMSRGKSYIEIDNKILFIPKELQDIAGYVNKESEVKIPSKALLEVNRLADALGVNPKSYIKKFLDHFIDEYPIEPPFDALLKDYQKEGLQWMLNLRQNGFGGCLADDMGLGKTIQAISFLSCWPPEKDAVALIIVPKIVLYNWEKEFSKFAPDKSVILVYGNFDYKKVGTYKNNSILITTYDTLLNHKDDFCSVNFDVVILDEAQYVKNYRTKRYQAINSLSKQTVFALTGTPIENSIEELWSLFNLINPGLLGNHGSFMQEYGDIHESAEKIERLRITITPFVLRRTKENVLKELPPKTENYVFCEMDEPQKSIYDKILTASQNELRAKPSRFTIKDNAAVLQALLYLREACVDTQLLPIGLRDGIAASSCKFELFKEYTREIMLQSGKLVIFSQFPRALQKLEKWCIRNKWRTYYIDGRSNNREKIIEEFEASTQGVFLISLKAGGVGLNLVSCQYVIIYEPWWNVAAEQQAANRIYRIGQMKPVFIYHFLVRNTIEEKVHELQMKKAVLSSSMLEGMSQPTKISMEELMDVLF